MGNYFPPRSSLILLFVLRNHPSLEVDSLLRSHANQEFSVLLVLQLRISLHFYHFFLTQKSWKRVNEVPPAGHHLKLTFQH